MKKYIFITIGVVCLCSCSTFKLIDTIWYNETITEKDGIKAAVYTTLYFGEDSVVNFNTSVRQDTMMIVAPCFTAYGKYIYSGNLRKGITIEIDAIDIDNLPIRYEGVIFEEGMVLVSQDSIAKGYKMAGNLRLNKKGGIL